jgi:hypothetical protein
MRNLKLKEVSEMVFRYMQDNQVNLLTAYEQVSLVLHEGNPFDYDTVKTFLFHNDMTLIVRNKSDILNDVG